MLNSTTGTSAYARFVVLIVEVLVNPLNPFFFLIKYQEVTEAMNMLILYM